MIRAKLVRKIPSFRGYPFDSYEYECIDCGTHYTRKAYNSRINPYCGECRKKYDKPKNDKRTHDKWKLRIIDELMASAKDERVREFLKKEVMK